MNGSADTKIIRRKKLRSLDGRKPLNEVVPGIATRLFYDPSILEDVSLIRQRCSVGVKTKSKFNGDRYVMAFVLRYLNNMTLSEIGKQLNVTKERVRQMVAVVVRILNAPRFRKLLTETKLVRVA
jgi:hypothetical protein